MNIAWGLPKLRIHSAKSAKIAIIGSGIVGEATGQSLFKEGHDVTFFDTNKDVLDVLHKDGYSAYVMSEFANHSKYFDFAFICTPTPFSNTGWDMSSVKNSISEIGKYLRQHAPNKTPLVIAIRSTVPIGANSELQQLMELEFSDLLAERDFIICSHPEYLRAHLAHLDACEPRAIIVGTLSRFARLAFKKLYTKQKNILHFLTPKEAEAHKLTHNLFNAAKISFFNEQRIIYDSEKIDTDIVFALVAETSEAIWNPMYGIRNMGPYGGACLPKDMEGFVAWASRRGYITPILKSVHKINKLMNQKTRI